MEVRRISFYGIGTIVLMFIFFNDPTAMILSMAGFLIVTHYYPQWYRHSTIKVIHGGVLVILTWILFNDLIIQHFIERHRDFIPYGFWGNFYEEFIWITWLTGVLLWIQQGLKIPYRQAKKRAQQHDDYYNQQVDQQANATSFSQSEESFYLGKTSSHERVSVSREALNRGTLLLGATGSGKTETLIALIDSCLNQGFFTLFVTAKPDKVTLERLKEKASKYQYQFYHYHGAGEEKFNWMQLESEEDIFRLKEKLMLLDSGSSMVYFKQIAEQCITAALTLLWAENQKKYTPFRLEALITLLDEKEWNKRLRFIENQKVHELFSRIRLRSQEDLIGIRAMLSNLLTSTLYRPIDPSGKKLLDVVKDRALMVVSLDSLTYPLESAKMGRVLINEIKTTLGSEGVHHPVFLIFDEYGRYASFDIEALLTMGRSLQAHTVLATQSLSDLKLIQESGRTLFEVIMDNISVCLSHRVNSNESALCVETFSGEITRESYRFSEKDKTFHRFYDTVPRVSREQVKTLKTGELLYIEKNQGGVVWRQLWVESK